MSASPPKPADMTEITVAVMTSLLAMIPWPMLGLFICQNMMERGDLVLYFCGLTALLIFPIGMLFPSKRRKILPLPATASCR